MMVVNPSQMQVTARVNQVDISQVHVGQSAEIRLEAYPDLVFPGKVESISAIGTRSDYVKRIRYFYDRYLDSREQSKAASRPDGYRRSSAGKRKGCADPSPGSGCHPEWSGDGGGS